MATRKEILQELAKADGQRAHDYNDETMENQYGNQADAIMRLAKKNNCAHFTDKSPAFQKRDMREF